MTTTVLTNLDFAGVGRITSLPDPSSAQDAATKAYVDGAIEGISWKEAVRVASVANINLTSPGSTIDGITMALNDRVLAKDQTDAKQNGIYIWSGAAVQMTRAADASTFAELEQAVVTVEEGTSQGTTYRQTAVNGTVGTDNISWSTFGVAVPDASETTAGKIEVATQSETDAGTDDARAVTPLKLKNYSGRAKRYAATIGDGSATSYAVTHNLGTRDCAVDVYRNSGAYDKVLTDVEHTDANTVTIKFASAPSSNAFRVVVVA